jgi:gag-polypeptide of LTR copia-type
MQLTKEFHSKILQRNQDPDIYITELEALQVKMEELGHPITDQSLILHVLNNLNDNYEMEIKMLEHKMQLYKESNKTITIDEVRTELNLRYERLCKTNKPIDHAYYMGTKYKGKCHWCGKIGHKASECRIKQSGKPKQNNGNSNNNTYNNNSSNNYNNNKNNTTNNNNNSRNDTFCAYCHKKGHINDECRKKKRDQESNNNNINMVKE